MRGNSMPFDSAHSSEGVTVEVDISRFLRQYLQVTERRPENDVVDDGIAPRLKLSEIELRGLTDGQVLCTEKHTCPCLRQDCRVIGKEYTACPKYQELTGQ